MVDFKELTFLLARSEVYSVGLVISANFITGSGCLIFISLLGRTHLKSDLILDAVILCLARSVSTLETRHAGP